MGETTDAIRDQIDQERHQLEENLVGIEERVKHTTEQVQERVQNATDWRQQFEQRPMLGLAIAFGGGMLLGSMIGNGEGRDRGYGPPPPQSYAQPYTGGDRSGADVGRQNVSNTMDHVKGALMGVAAAQLRSFLGSSLPGFDDEYKQVERESDTASQRRSGTGVQSTPYGSPTPEPPTLSDTQPRPDATG